MYLEHLFCFKYQTQPALQHDGMYLVTMDTEVSDITAPYLYPYPCAVNWLQPTSREFNRLIKFFHCVNSHSVALHGNDISMKFEELWPFL